MAIGTKVGDAHVKVSADVDESEAADRISDGITSAASSAAKKAGAGLATAGAAVGGVFGGAVVLGLHTAMDREVVLDQLNASLGATGEEAERYGQIAGDLYAKAWGDSLEEVARGVQVVEQALGEIGNTDLETATASALDLAKVMEEDVGRVAQTAGQLVRNGLAATTEEAFDLLAAGATNGLNRTEDLLDTLNEYAPAFSRLGIDGDQALGLLNQGLEQGVFNTDKIGDAFNEFSIRAIDGSKASVAAIESLRDLAGQPFDADQFSAAIAAGGDAAAEATGQALSALNRMDDQIEQDAAGVALFGSMWEDLGAEAILALDPMNDGLGEVDGAAGKLSDTLNDNLSTKLESLKRRGLQVLADFVERNVVPALEKFADWAGEHLPQAFDYFEREVLPIIRNVGDFIVDTFATVQDWTEEHWPQIQEMITSTVDTISTVVTTVLDALALAWETWGDNIVTFVTNSIEPTIQVIQGLWDFLTGLIDFIVGVFTGDWERAWDGIKSMFTGAWDVIVGTVELAWERVKLAVGIIIDGVKLLWDWSFLSDWVSTAVDGVVGFFRDMPGRLGDLIDGIKDKAAEIGAAIKDGIVDGFSSAAGFAGDLVSGLWDAFRDLFNDQVVDRINDAIPNSLGFGPFSVDLPNDPVPRLADGGVLTRPTLVVAGDNTDGRPEIVTPERLMAQVFGQVLDSRDTGGVVFEPGSVVVSLASGSEADARRAGEIVGDAAAARINARRARVKHRAMVGVT